MEAKREARVGAAGDDSVGVSWIRRHTVDAAGARGDAGEGLLTVDHTEELRRVERAERLTSDDQLGVLVGLSLAVYKSGLNGFPRRVAKAHDLIALYAQNQAAGDRPLAAAPHLSIDRGLETAIAQLGDRVEDAGGSRLQELLLGEAAGEHPYRLQPGPLCRLAIPGRVAHHDGALSSSLLERNGHKIGLRLGHLDVRRGRPVVGQLARLE